MILTGSVLLVGPPPPCCPKAPFSVARVSWGRWPSNLCPLSRVLQAGARCEPHCSLWWARRPVEAGPERAASGAGEAHCTMGNWGWWAVGPQSRSVAGPDSRLQLHLGCIRVGWAAAVAGIGAMAQCGDCGDQHRLQWLSGARRVESCSQAQELSSDPVSNYLWPPARPLW